MGVANLYVGTMNTRSLALILLCALVAMIPLDGFQIQGISVTRITGVALIPMIVILILMSGHIYRFKNIHYLALISSGWVVASVFWSIDQNATWSRMDSWLQLSTIPLIIWQIVRDERSQKVVINSYIIGASLAAAFSISGFITGDFARASAGGKDPNELGVALAIALPLAWYIWNTVGYRLPLLYIPLGATAITLTASRTAVVLLIIGIMAILWNSRSSKGIARITLPILIAAGSYLAINHTPSSVSQRILEVFNQTSEGDFNGRAEIWTHLLSELPNHAFIGTGFNTTRAVTHGNVDDFRYEGMVAHNILLSIFTEQGIIGVIIFFGMFGIVWHSAKAKKTQKWVWQTAIILWFVGSLFLTAELQKFTWLLLGLAATASLPNDDNSSTDIFQFQKKTSSTASDLRMRV